LGREIEEKSKGELVFSWRSGGVGLVAAGLGGPFVRSLGTFETTITRQDGSHWNCVEKERTASKMIV